MVRNTSAMIDGFVRPGFEPVRDVFVANFNRGKELGAACCIYYRGEPVVDIWGGVRDKATGAPWESDTMVIVFSATKGMSAMVTALANSRGLLDYDERVCTYWPEFAQQGKDRITVRQLLAHQAGLFAFDEPVDKSVIADLDRLAEIMARQKPAWEPGARQAYHAISLGFYQGELIRRVDPRHRTLGQYFQDEIATPLGLDFYIRLPETMPDSRLAILQMYNPFRMIFHYPLRMTLSVMNPRSVVYRSVVSNPGTLIGLDPDRIYARNFEVPSGGGVGTARAIARAYSEFATGGPILGLREEMLAQLKAPAGPPVHGFHDECLKVDARFSLGFTKPGPGYLFGPPSAFGTPGAGGSFGFADPDTEIGYGYVMNRMAPYLEDPRDRALRTAMYRALGEKPPGRAQQPAAAVRAGTA
jgi:CubicO group peptidase (beta-lactamase class C family)